MALCRHSCPDMLPTRQRRDPGLRGQIVQKEQRLDPDGPDQAIVGTVFPTSRCYARPSRTFRVWHPRARQRSLGLLMWTGCPARGKAAIRLAVPGLGLRDV